MNLIVYLQAQPALAIGVALLLGLLVGSFLNVVVYRLPVMMERDWRRQCAELDADAEAAQPSPAPERFDLVAPRSRCPSCGHAITALENVPVLSWLALRGRCSGCGTAISARYPAVELLSGLMSALVVWRFGVNLAGGGALLLTWALIAASFIDVDKQLLPDSITLPLLWLGLVFNLAGAYVPLADAVLGAIAGYGVLWLVYHAFRRLTGKEGMGYGDFKLLAALGAWLGWQQLPMIILMSAVVGAVVGIALMIFRKHERAVPIPFGPYLAAAGWIAMLWGDTIKTLYLDTLL